MRVMYIRWSYKKLLVPTALLFSMLYFITFDYIDLRRRAPTTADPMGIVDGKSCKKQMRFHYTKVEKTGSSTLASILYRFVLEHQTQNVMVMTYGGHLDITKRRTKVPGWDIGPYSSPSGRADVLIDHCRYNEYFIQTHFHPDTPLIVSVRDAVSWFQSAVRFWTKHLRGKNYQKKDRAVTAHDVLSGNMSYITRSVLHDEYNGQRTILHLSQLQWLGFDYNKHADMQAIQSYIQYIVDKFDHIFLTDDFDAALIDMRRKFCWSHSDILYQSTEVYGAGKSYVSDADRKAILSERLNLPDQWLYEAFRKRWQSQIYSEDLKEEVKYFQKINRDQKRRCQTILDSDDKLTHYTYPASKWSSQVVLDRRSCLMLSRPKYKLMTDVGTYALGIKYYLNEVYKLFDYYWWFKS